MRIFLIIAAIFLFIVPAFADTTLSRDGEGLKMQGGAPVTIRSASLGTKGFKCWSTASKIWWEVKVTATDSTQGAGLGFKMFYNGVEDITYPISDAFYQFQNAPVSKTPMITSVCQRAYSSATEKTASGLFQ